MDCNTTYLRNHFMFNQHVHCFSFFSCSFVFLLCSIFIDMSEINVINDFAHQQLVLELILLVPS